MVHLSRAGYLLQAWAIGTSLLESAFSVGYICSDDKHAATWLQHKDFTRVPWTMRAAVRVTARSLGLPEAEESWYGNFTKLSSAKHPNPTILKRYGVQAGVGKTRIQVDPHYNRGIAILLRLGLTYGLHAAGIAMWAFAKRSSTDPKLDWEVIAFAQETADLLSAVRDDVEIPSS
jgi:hypothetical protein